MNVKSFYRSHTYSSECVQKYKSVFGLVCALFCLDDHISSLLTELHYSVLINCIKNSDQYKLFCLFWPVLLFNLLQYLSFLSRLSSEVKASHSVNKIFNSFDEILVKIRKTMYVMKKLKTLKGKGSIH